MHINPEAKPCAEDVLFHIAHAEDWEVAQRAGVYLSDSLAAEGFIHCSTGRQVMPVANALFRGQRGLALLCIDSGRVGAEIRYEKAEGEECFPHIYGPLEVGAVFRVVKLEPGPDGSFELPAEARTAVRGDADAE